MNDVDPVPTNEKELTLTGEVMEEVGREEWKDGGERVREREGGIGRELLLCLETIHW